MKPLIIAHRGTSADAPENTMAAFRKAIEVGADGIEFDVQLSADGVPVVIHDKSLGRTANMDGKVKDMTAEELTKIDVGAWFSQEFKGETVPLLSDVFELFAGNKMLLYLELKCNRKNYKPLAKAVAGLIRESGMQERIVVLSFMHDALLEIRRELPEIETATLFEPKPLSILRIRRKFIKLAKKFKAGQIAPHYSLVTKRSVDSAHIEGIPTIVWTANKPRFLKKAMRIGLYAVITNHAKVFIEKREELFLEKNWLTSDIYTRFSEAA